MDTRYEMRDAGMADVEQLVRMRLELETHLSEKNPYLWQFSAKKISGLPDSYRATIQNPSSKVLVVEDRQTGHIVGMGFGRVVLLDGFVQNKSGSIDDIWIDPVHRRKGLCRELVSQLVRFFKIEGVEFLALEYVDGNREAEATWKSLGFRTVIRKANAMLSDVQRKCD